MFSEKKCPECGEAISPGALDGLCAQCLFSLGLEAPGTPAPALPPPDLGPLLAKTAPGIGVKFHYFGDYELLGEIARGGMGIGSPSQSNPAASASGICAACASNWPASISTGISRLICRQHPPFGRVRCGWLFIPKRRK